jgi:hypothetical protein
MNEYPPREGLRERWEFTVPAGRVAAAAEMKRQHHAGRLDHWQSELAVADRDFREHGIEISAPPVATSTASYRDDVSVDHKRKQRVSDAQAKVREHSDKAAEYERYVRAVESLDAEAPLSLTVRDFEFFGL